LQQVLEPEQELVLERELGQGLGIELWLNLNSRSELN
jgi:hypothetical protein